MQFGPAGQRQREDGNHRVARAGNVKDFARGSADGNGFLLAFFNRLMPSALRVIKMESALRHFQNFLPQVFYGFFAGFWGQAGAFPRLFGVGVMQVMFLYF